MMLKMMRMATGNGNVRRWKENLGGLGQRRRWGSSLLQILNAGDEGSDAASGLRCCYATKAGPRRGGWFRRRDPLQPVPMKTAPPSVDAAAGITQGTKVLATKVLAEGDYEKKFRQTFVETFPEEQLHESYACYFLSLSTLLKGMLYLSTAKVAFSTDNLLPGKNFQLLIPLNRLKVNPSVSNVNAAVKYIQLCYVGTHYNFWFLGFVDYDSAVKHLQEAALHGRAAHSV